MGDGGMNHDEVTRWRLQMGEALAPWGRGAGRYFQATSDAWIVLSGLPSPDVNMALVSDDNPTVLAGALAMIKASGCPALVLLAGAGKTRSGDLPEEWQHVGAMPMMRTDLGSAALVPDPRVRRAGSADGETVTGLTADAFGMAREVVSLVTEGLGAPVSPMAIWLLEHEGEAVSSVVSVRVEDTVSLWCMATPERFGRRGYGRALLATVLHHAQADGATIGLLGATPAGRPLYEATGWQQVESWDIYTNAVSAQFEH